MKRWFLLTLGLYAAMFSLLAAPAAWLAFWPKTTLSESVSVFGEPIFWIALGLLVAAQALLLLVPVHSARDRPKPRRKLLIPVITGAFFMAVLVLCIALCLFLAIWGERSDSPFRGFFSGENGNIRFLATMGLITLLGWIFWAWMFYRYRKSVDPDLLTNRLMRWLLAGSIVELLVAVPSHIIVRQRGDCCAPAGTFFGIACGFSVMLLSFGPGVFFLFARRMDLLRGRQKGHCRHCNYDLQAHHPGDRCPECGTPIPPEIPQSEPVASAAPAKQNP